MKHKRQYPGASPYFDRHGVRRWRYRKHGRSFELGTEYGSQDFIQRYEAAVKGAKPASGTSRIRPETVDDLVVRYYRSRAFADLSDGTKANYRGIIERFRSEHGSKRVRGLKTHHVESLIAEKSATPAAANNFRKRLGQLLDLAVRLEWLQKNPVRETKPYSVASGGHHTWTEAEIARFFAFHRPGTLPHLAVTLMLYTGAARVDAVKLGWFSVKNAAGEDRIEYRRQKTQRQNGQLISIRLHPDLARVLEDCPKSHGTFLQTVHGKQRSEKSLGGDMRRWCDAAGLPTCSAHGLRKACARRLAESGVTGPEIMAVTGHTTLSEVQRYIAEASRPNTADSAMAKLLARPNGEQTVVNLPERFAKNETNHL